MISRLRLAFALSVIGPVTLVLLPVQILLMATRTRLAEVLPVFWHRLAVFLLGIRVHFHGEFPRDRPLMIVANHLSWADIPVLSSIGPVSFVAKREVAVMGVVNLLAWLQRTVLVSREDRRGSLEQARRIADRLAGGDAMVLFAEGTTGAGNRVSPFKSSLFGSARMAARKSDRPVTVLPVSICYNRLHGLPISYSERSLVAWPGDIKLLPHLARKARLAAWDVQVRAGRVVSFDADTDRRSATRDCHAQISLMYRRDLLGRDN